MQIFATGVPVFAVYCAPPQTGGLLLNALEPNRVNLYVFDHLGFDPKLIMLQQGAKSVTVDLVSTANCKARAAIPSRLCNSRHQRGKSDKAGAG